MTKTTHMSPRRQSSPASLGQWLLGGSALAISLAVGSISMTFNFKFGLQAGFISACIFAVADAAKLSIPFMGQMFGWRFGFGKAFNVSAYAICLITSLTCAGFHLTQERAQERIDIAAQETKLAGASFDQDAARAALTAITEVSTADALETQLASARMIAAGEESRAKEADLICAQRTKCVDAAKTRDKLVERLGLAKQRDKLQESLAAAKTEAGSVSAKAIGPADDIAAWTGTSKTTAAIGVSLFLTILQLLVLEVLAPFSGVAAGIFADAMSRRKAGNTTGAPARSTKFAVQPIEPQTPKARALLKLQVKCWNAPGGVLIASKSALFQAFKDDGFATTRTAFYEWCKEWETNGEIEVREVKSAGKRSSEIRARRKAA